MADSDLTAALAGSLEILDSPLSEATPDSIDELLARIRDNLVEGVPGKISDEDLKKAVVLYRAESLRWKQEEDIKASKPRGQGRKSFSQAVDIEL